MRTQNKQVGFTLIELLIVIAVILILTTISVLVFKNIETTSYHRVITQDIYLTLTEARNNSMASDDDTVYGVHFATTSVTLFEGNTYSISDPNNVYIGFTGGVHATGSLAVNNTDVVFKRLSGFPTATGTIFIINGDSSATNTVTIHDTGLIEN